MRLEKHTEDEIDRAREESGFARPNEDQIKEWRKVHEKMNADLAQAANNRISCYAIGLDQVIWPHLSRMGQMVARGKGTSTVLELIHNNKSDVDFPWYKSGLIGYDYINEAVLEGMDTTFSRRSVFCRSLTKLIEIDKGDTEKLEYWVKRFAVLFNKLANACKIQYGILAPFMALQLADKTAESAGEQALEQARLVAQAAGARIPPEKLAKIEATKAKIRVESKTRRILLMVYPYSHLEREELNEWLGNEAFVEEGGIGSDDWAGLPDIG